jgi:glutamate N-acetyltransferase/amino-acid N-acetyltransferase
MKPVQGGITAPKGFLSSGIHCGIKYKNRDLALVFSQVSCQACGMFTQNKVQAAPVRVSKAHLKNNTAQAVIINSGNANCCTGEQGIQDAQEICQAVAGVSGIEVNDVLIASTGIIGKRLPLKKIINGIEPLIDKLNTEAGLAAAEAIMTTDTRPKQVSVEIKIGNTPVRVGGMAKGAGMIQPNLATMLAFITTDAAIDGKKLKKAVQEAVENSFNLITVEGDTSTNDMVAVLANGLAANKAITGQDFKVFQKALNFVCLSLAKMMVEDAEGASKFVQIQVEKAKSVSQAKKVAFKIANSALVKTAIFGENTNWGRIAACAGAADEAVKENSLNIYFGPVKVLQNGVAVKINQQRLKRVLKKKEIEIRIVLGLGTSEACVFSCDLSHKYVSINARY